MSLSPLDRLAANFQHIAAHPQGDPALVGVNLDVPGLRAFLAPVEIGR